MKVNFLFGTESGTAEMVCEDLQEAFPNIESSISNLDAIDPSALSQDTLHVLVCSTFGTGDLPASAIPFVDALNATRPDLSHIRFAIFGLGDTIFDDTYGQGSEKLMEVMLAHGAKMVGERVVADASGGEMPGDVAIEWLKSALEVTN